MEKHRTGRLRDRVRVSGLLSGVLTGVMFSGVVFGAFAGSTPYVVQATIGSGTCSIDVSPSSLPPVTVMTEEMAGGGVQGASPIVIFTTGCSGVGMAGKTPSVMVSGDTYDAQMPGSLGGFAEGEYLFYTSAASKAQWAGFVLSKTEAGVKAWDTTGAAYLKNGSAAPLVGTKDNCGVAGCATRLWVGLACGTTATCNTHFSSGGNAGSLKTTVTFTFAYN